MSRYHPGQGKLYEFRYLNVRATDQISQLLRESRTSLLCFGLCCALALSQHLHLHNAKGLPHGTLLFPVLLGNLSRPVPLHNADRRNSLFKYCTRVKCHVAGWKDCFTLRHTYATHTPNCRWFKAPLSKNQSSLTNCITGCWKGLAHQDDTCLVLGATLLVPPARHSNSRLYGLM